MQREELINRIGGNPPIRVSARLRKMLNEKPAEEKFCENADCFNLHTNRRFCSRACCSAQISRERAKLGGEARGNKIRGSNPNRHIQIRVNGKLRYLHHVIVEREMGVKLDTEREIVHHVDGNKHHNCFWKSVNSCPYPHPYDMPNLEILTGDARREHLERHQEEMQRARRRKK